MQRTARIGACLLAVLALAGCRADVRTSLDVTSPTEARAQVTAAFSGQIADALVTDATSRESLVQAFRSRQLEPQCSAGQGQYQCTVDVPAADVSSLSAITGVADLRITPDATGQAATVTAQLVSPSALVTAVDRFAKEATTSPAGVLPIRDTARSQVSTTFAVTFPGPVSQATAPADQSEQNTAAWTRFLDQEDPVQVSATGSLDAGMGIAPFAAAVVAALALLVAAVAWRRRRIRP